MTFHTFKHCNVDELNSDLSQVPWSVIDVFDNINDRWECWKKFFWEIIDMHALVITVRKKKKSRPWITSDIISSTYAEEKLL